MANEVKQRLTIELIGDTSKAKNLEELPKHLEEGLEKVLGQQTKVKKLIEETYVNEKGELDVRRYVNVELERELDTRNKIALAAMDAANYKVLSSIKDYGAEEKQRIKIEEELAKQKATLLAEEQKREEDFHRLKLQYKRKELEYFAKLAEEQVNTEQRSIAEETKNLLDFQQLKLQYRRQEQQYFAEQAKERVKLIEQELVEENQRLADFEKLKESYRRQERQQWAALQKEKNRLVKQEQAEEEQRLKDFERLKEGYRRQEIEQEKEKQKALLQTQSAYYKQIFADLTTLPSTFGTGLLPTKETSAFTVILEKEEQQLQATIQKLKEYDRELDNIGKGTAKRSATNFTELFAEQEQAIKRQLENLSEYDKQLNSSGKKGTAKQSFSAFSSIFANEEDTVKNLKHSGDDYLKEIKRQVAEAREIKISGEKSARTILLQAENATNRELESLAKARLKIEQDVLAGVKSTTQAQIEQKNLLAEAEKKLLAIQNGLPDNLKQLGGSVKTLGEHFGRLVRHITEVYVVWGVLNTVTSKFSEAIHSIIPVGVALDSVKSSLLSTMGSSAGAEGALQALREEAKRTGSEIGVLRTNFANFQASTSLAGASLEDTWKMFQNLNTVSVALHKTTDETQHIFLAVSQIFNKSKVQSEELVKQLGNLLPGAFAVFAESMKISTGKLSQLMKEGLVMSKETMLQFTQTYAEKFAGSFALAAQMINADIGRMKSEFTLLGEVIYGKSTGAISEFTRGMANSTESIRRFIETSKLLSPILYGLKDSIISLATAGVFFLTTKLAALEKGLAFLRTPTALVGGIGLLVSAFTDYIHSTQEASLATAKFFEELKRQKELANASPEVRIRIAIENSEGVKNVSERIKDVLREIEETRPTVNNITKPLYRTSAVIDQLNSEISLLRKYDSTLREISRSEYMFGIDRKNYVKLREAELKALLEQKEFEVNKSRDEVQASEDEARKREREGRYENEARRKYRQSEVEEFNVQLAERKRIRAQEAGDVAAQEGAIDEKAAAEARSRMLRLEETYSEQFAKLREKEKKLAKRKDQGPPDAFDAAKEQEFAEERKTLQIGFDKEKLQAENEAERAKLALKKQRDSEYKYNTLEGKVGFEQEEEALVKLKAAYDAGTISIARYWDTWRQKKMSALGEKMDALSANVGIAHSRGDFEKEAEFKKKMDLLAVEGTKIWDTAEAGKDKDLREYNKRLAKNAADLELAQGRKESGYADKVRLQYAEEILRLESEIRDTLAEEERIKTNPDEEINPKTLEAHRIQAQASLDQIKQLEAIKVAEGQLKDLEVERKSIADDYEAAQRSIEIDLKTGAISQLGSEIKLSKINEEHIAQLEEKLALEKQIVLAQQGQATPERIAKIKKEELELKNLKADADLVARHFEASVGGAFNSAFANLISGSETASQAFRSFGQSVIKTIGEIAAQELQTSLLKPILGMAFSGISNGFSKLFSSPSITPTTEFMGAETAALLTPGKLWATGGAFDKGDIITSPTLFDRDIMGEAGPEAIVPLAKGPDGKLGIANLGPTQKSPTQALDNSTNTVYNTHNISVTVTQQQGQNAQQTGQQIGQEILRALVKKEIADANRSGNFGNRLGRVA